MNALVPAGGKGNRSRPITHAYTKQLVPVANEPVLFYDLDALRVARIHDMGVIVGDTAGAIIPVARERQLVRAEDLLHLLKSATVIGSWGPGAIGLCW